MIRRGLVVCTANLCRSPVAERLLQRALESDAAVQPWSISSAGLVETAAPIDRNTVAAAAEVGIDLAGHTPRVLDATMLARDGRDLVLAMTRANLRDVVAIDPGAWPRTFTLKELARLAAAAPSSDSEGFDSWLRRMAHGRRAADLMMPSAHDDVADPYGHPRREHDAMVRELTREVAALVQHGPCCSHD